MTKYLIKQGNHRKSDLKFKLHLGSPSLMFQVQFDNSCWYKYENTDSYDINKLCGASFGYHHKDSLRFGWVPDFNSPGEIQIWSYLYNKSERKYNHLCNCKIGEKYDLSIIIGNGNVHYLISGDDFECSNYEPFILPKFKWGYYLYPYFGGNNKAPHDIVISLNIL